MGIPSSTPGRFSLQIGPSPCVKVRSPGNEDGWVPYSRKLMHNDFNTMEINSKKINAKYLYFIYGKLTSYYPK